MRQTETVTACNIIYKNISNLLSVKKTHKKGLKLAESFVDFLVSGVCNEEILDFSNNNYGLRKPVKFLENTLGKINKLPQALCAYYFHNVPKNKAIKEWNVKKSDFEYVDNLVSEYINDTMLLLNSFVEKEIPWIAEFEFSREEIEVILDTRALEDLLLSSLETYKVKKGKTKFTEFYGLCLGMAREIDIESSIRGFRKKSCLNVMRVAPQLRADMRSSEVTPNYDSWNSLIEASERLFPYMEILADIHSHPYNTLNELMINKGWELSKQDKVNMPEFVYYLKSKDHPIRISLLVAISRGKEKHISTHKKHENILRFYIGGSHVFISVYRVASNGKLGDKGIRLTCPAITGMGFKH